MRLVKTKPAIIESLKQLKMNRVTKTTVTAPTEHYDYELLTLALKWNGAN